MVKDGGVKWFSLSKLVWRHIHDPKQFTNDESLFERAKLIDREMPSLVERIRITAQRKSQRIRLDHPLLVESGEKVRLNQERLKELQQHLFRLKKR